MSGEELSDAEISLLRDRISLAANCGNLTHHESEALADCRTDVLGFRGEAELPPFALVLRLIASRTLAEAPIAILAWAFWAAPRSPLWPVQEGTRANIRFIFQAMVTRLHSPRAFSSPRIEN